MLASLAASVFVFFLQPPEGYRHDAQAQVKFLNPRKMTAYCEGLGVRGEREPISACTRGRFMVLPNPCDWPVADAYAELTCHELGHRNLWRHEADPRFPLQVPTP